MKAEWRRRGGGVSHTASTPHAPRRNPCHLTILAHSTSRIDAAKHPPTPYAMALLAVTRRDIVASVRRAVASESSAPCSASRACVITSLWRCRSVRMDAPSS